MKAPDLTPDHKPNSEPITEPPTSSSSSPGTSKLIIKIPANITKDNISDQTAMEEDKPERCTFCPEELCQPIIDMIERHFCAHPLIPGYCPLLPAYTNGQFK